MVAGLCKIIEQCVSSHWRFTHVQLVSACVKEGATGLFECNAVRAVCCTDSTVVAYWSDYHCVCYENSDGDGLYIASIYGRVIGNR